MPRKHIVTKKEMIARRAKEWEYHYNNRRKVQEVFAIYDPLRVASTITREIPPPVMRLDGSLIEGIATIRGRSKAAYYLSIDQSQKELMCLWYWTQEGWSDFERQFQALPDVTEDHYLVYDEEADAVLLAPVSQKQPVQVRYKSGTSQVLVPKKQVQPATA